MAGDTRFECEAHGPILTSSCWTCAASGEMTSRVQVDMSRPLYVPPLPTAERIAAIRAEYEANRACAETYGCSMDARCVRDLLAVFDAEVAAHAEARRVGSAAVETMLPAVRACPVWKERCERAERELDGARADVLTAKAERNALASVIDEAAGDETPASVLAVRLGETRAKVLRNAAEIFRRRVDAHRGHGPSDLVAWHDEAAGVLEALAKKAEA